jgi:hypothetical protein
MEKGLLQISPVLLSTTSFVTSFRALSGIRRQRTRRLHTTSKKNIVIMKNRVKGILTGCRPVIWLMGGRPVATLDEQW